MNWVLLLLILALCPLMHFWMMRKGGHGPDEHKKEDQKEGGE